MITLDYAIDTNTRMFVEWTLGAEIDPLGLAVAGTNEALLVAMLNSLGYVTLEDDPAHSSLLKCLLGSTDYRWLTLGEVAFNFATYTLADVHDYAQGLVEDAFSQFTEDNQARYEHALADVIAAAQDYFEHWLVDWWANGY